MQILDTGSVRTLVGAPCSVLHRLWWLPLWNQSSLLNCPIAWLCNRSIRFDRWFWEMPDLEANR